MHSNGSNAKHKDPGAQTPPDSYRAAGQSVQGPAGGRRCIRTGQTLNIKITAIKLRPTRTAPWAICAGAGGQECPPSVGVFEQVRRKNVKIAATKLRPTRTAPWAICARTGGQQCPIPSLRRYQLIPSSQSIVEMSAAREVVRQNLRLRILTGSQMGSPSSMKPFKNSR